MPTQFQLANRFRPPSLQEMTDESEIEIRTEVAIGGARGPPDIAIHDGVNPM